jgi:hypothetical protein
MPAHAGIQSPHAHGLDSRFRGNDATQYLCQQNLPGRLRPLVESVTTAHTKDASECESA